MEWCKAAQSQADPGRDTIDPFKSGMEDLGAKMKVRFASPSVSAR